jgi:hypothetical protein
VVCSEARCDVKVYARGHCSRHYRQLLRTGQVHEDHAPMTCAVTDCERKAVTRGWCRRSAGTLDPETGPPLACELPDYEA